MKNQENIEKEYFLITKTENLEGTCYFEFLPGKYEEKCWNKESVFLTEESIAFFEDFLHKVSSEYDHFAFTELNREQISSLIDLIDERISLIKSVDQYKISGELFSEKYYENLSRELLIYKNDILSLLVDLNDWMRKILKTKDRITVMGL